MAERPKNLNELNTDWKIHVISGGEATAATPGGLSIGQQSSVSGYSVGSRCQFLKGRTEKDAYVQTHIEKMQHKSAKPERPEDECGIGRCHPAFLNYFANIKSFVVLMSLLLATSGTMSTGYFNSVITTIEKRFEIGSSISGLIAASYEFGSLVAVVFISYLGGRRHIPKWIGYGIIIMGFGALLFALPHIIAEKYTIDQGIISNLTEENICKTSDKNGDMLQNCIDKNSGNWIYVLILIAAQVLIGTGGTPILTLGTTYVDNHVAKDKAPAYLAFIYASGVLGPVLGYAMGALLLQYYVDMFSYEVDILPADPRWIGAWWGGFIICGCIFFVLSVPFMAFPKTLLKEKRKVLEQKAREDLLSDDLDTEQSRHSEEYGKTIKDIPRSILKLLKNKIYLITCFGICCEISIVSGFVIFLPKYLETQFGTSKSVANLFTGGIGIPGAVVGILLGGFILKRFQLRPKGAVQLSLVLNILAFFVFVSFFVLGCDNIKIAGATFPYSAYFNSSEYERIETNLTSSCNMDCDCSPNDLEPICGINGITYFSPCHAGCTKFYSYITPAEKLMNFSGCACILDNITISPEVIMSPVATSGPCKSTCQNLFPFLILLVIVTFTVAGTQMPLLMVTLRSVHEEERCFALGMQFVILRLFAYIPSPIMFGNTIDTSCLLWRENCGYHGSCLVYDIVQFRYKYVGMSAGLKLLGTALFCVVLVLIRKRNKRDQQNTLTVGEMMNSVNSINKMDMDYDQRHYSPYKHRSTKHSASSAQYDEPIQQPHHSADSSVKDSKPTQCFQSLDDDMDYGKVFLPSKSFEHCQETGNNLENMDTLNSDKTSYMPVESLFVELEASNTKQSKETTDKHLVDSDEDEESLYKAMIPSSESAL